MAEGFGGDIGGGPDGEAVEEAEDAAAGAVLDGELATEAGDPGLPEDFFEGVVLEVEGEGGGEDGLGEGEGEGVEGAGVGDGAAEEVFDFGEEGGVGGGPGDEVVVGAGGGGGG